RDRMTRARSRCPRLGGLARAWCRCPPGRGRPCPRALRGSATCATHRSIPVAASQGLGRRWVVPSRVATGSPAAWGWGSGRGSVVVGVGPVDGAVVGGVVPDGAGGDDAGGAADDGAVVGGAKVSGGTGAADDGVVVGGMVVDGAAGAVAVGGVVVDGAAAGSA